MTRVWLHNHGLGQISESQPGNLSALQLPSEVEVQEEENA
jgi:hypothetical protein